MGKYSAETLSANYLMRKLKGISKNIKFFGIIFFVLCMCFLVKTQAQTPEQIHYFSERIEFGTEDIKRNALFDLRNYRTETASRIAIPALKDSLEIVRATATHSVVFLPKNEAVQVLLPLLNEKSEFVRRETAYALGEVESDLAIQSLINLLQKDKKLEVRTASAIALGQIGDISATLVLMNILQKKPKDNERFLRRAAARSIGQIAQNLQRGDEEPLVTPESFLPENFKEFIIPKYCRLIETFPVFQNANALLIRILQNEKETDDTKREAAFALGEIGDASSVPILTTNLNSEDYYLAEISEESLRKVYQNIKLIKSDN
ncbi:MAG: HEAT repeat domain-containing protein [Aridibacter sp.]